MADETKVPVAPEATDDESFIDNRRAEIEKLVIAENEFIPEPEVTPEEAPKQESKQESPKVEEAISEDPVERIKKSVQKRIDKVVAQKKSVEEENAELKAEVERLKSERANPKQPEAPQDNTPPTIEQVEAYIVKMKQEGNAEEEVRATRYLIKLEKEAALKEMEDKQRKELTEAESVKQKQLQEWTGLCSDYVAYGADGQPDAKSDLTLANQNSLLYKTALTLYNDKELHAQHYNDPNVINGFRRAVADAYREIHQQGLLNKTPKGEPITEPKRTPRQSLAEPEAEAIEEVAAPNTSSLSDAEKVREEIRNRNKNRFIRPRSQS